MDLILLLKYCNLISAKKGKVIIMKRGLCVFLSIAVIALTLCSCSFIKDKDAISSLTYTDSQGQTHQYKTDENGKAVTNKNGEKETTTAADIDSDSMNYVAVTDKNGEYVTNKDGSVVTSKVDWNEVAEQMTSAPSSGTNDKGGSSTSTTAPYGSSEDDLLDDGKKTNKTNLKATVIDAVVKTGNYTLDTTVKSGDMDVPTVFTFKGKDFAASLTMPMGSTKIEARVFSKDDKYYMAMPTLMGTGIYGELDEETFEDYSSASGSISQDATYVKSTTVKDGSTTLTCEEYKAKDGTVIKYYFNSKKEWKRWEIIDSEGGVSVFIINSLAKGAKESLFQISSKWKKMDLTGMV